MSSRYEQAQAKAVAEWAQVSGSDKFNMFVAKNVLAQYAIDFQLALEKFLNERQVV